MNPYDLPFRENDSEQFDKICVSMTQTGLDAAFAKFPNKNYDRKSLKGKWEGFHLVKFTTYTKNKIADDDTLNEIYKPFKWSISKLQRYGSDQTLRNKEDIENVFKCISRAQGISLFECFLNFLEFCSKENKGRGFLFSAFNYSQETLLKEIEDKRDYLTKEFLRLGITSSISGKSFDGLSFIWEKPNNKHEPPICRIEPGFAQKQLIIPNTYDNIDLEQPSTVLGWSSQITPFIGRNDEIKHLTDWLDSDADKSIQLISGDGGTGKTRLAFHFAEEIAIDKGWDAGQATSDLRGHWHWNDKGILLIIDYPEERKTTVRQFLKAVYEMDDIPKSKRLRVLLLSRDDEFIDLVEEEAPRLSNRPIHLKGLSTENLQWALAQNMWDGLEYQRKNTEQSRWSNEPEHLLALKKNEFLEWQERQLIHKTPLMVMALIYYINSEPDSLASGILELTAQNIIRYMTKREIRFIRKEVSEYFGLKKLVDYPVEGIFLLRAVAAISEGFAKGELVVIVKRINEMSLKYQLPDADHIVSGFARGDNFLQVSPDILAADFLFYCFEKWAGGQEHNWISAVIMWDNDKQLQTRNEKVIENFNKLGRLVFDMRVRLSLEWQDSILKPLVEDLPAKAFWIAKYLSGRDMPYHLSPMVAYSLHYCLDNHNHPDMQQEITAAELARYCFNLSVLYFSENKFDEAFSLVKKILPVYEKTFKMFGETYAPEYLYCLRLLANIYFNKNAFQSGLEEINKVLHITKPLLEKNVRMYGLNYAQDLKIKTALLSSLNSFENAENCIKESVRILRQLVTLHDKLYYKQLLAESLVEQGTLYTDPYNPQSAKKGGKFTEESIDIYEKLVREDYQLYAPHLSIALNNYAMSLHHAGEADNATVLKPIMRAIDIIQPLAHDNFERFGLELASRYYTISHIIVERRATGFEKYGFFAIQSVLIHYAQLAKSNFGMYGDSFSNSIGIYIRYLTQYQELRNSDTEGDLKALYHLFEQYVLENEDKYSVHTFISLTAAYVSYFERFYKEDMPT
ncbi:hypothetical protein [Agarilytica rhodophyticola]|uniref:hypothetical protein n=1 Tax=Agarilytica rhodophyticola TaxID=1737490 RepID=UPI000B34746C|nr:hypothetical protein [Agarilytica rhodophyticola]